MKISAVVGCKDEADLLGPVVQALLRAGVATVTLIDEGSTDGSDAVIAELTRQPQVFSLSPVEAPRAREDLDGPLFGQILRRDAPDWLFFCDADEFLLPASGRIADTRGLAPGMADVIIISRFNALLPEGPVRPEDLASDTYLRGLELALERPWLSRESLREQPENPWILHRIVPKVMVRTSRVGAIQMGGHDAFSRNDQPLRRRQGDDLLIAHLPFTTYDRFGRKLDNIVETLAPFDEAQSGGKAWHWFHWREEYLAGRGPEEFARQRLTPQRRATMRAAEQLGTTTEIFAWRAAGRLLR